MTNFDAPKSIKFDFTGQIEEQNKQMSFLMGALFTGLGLIMLILVFQFIPFQTSNYNGCRIFKLYYS
jgi:multidrug efflux pump subunit AcrB